MVQLYYSAPYTELDVQYKIENPVRILLAFGKVSVPAGQSVTTEITFSKEDMASYCDTYANADCTIWCWMLEGGDYTITLGKNSHEAWATETVSVADTIWYTGENIRQSDKDAQTGMNENGELLGYPAAAEADPDAAYVPVHNRFQDSTDYMHTEATILTRNDWAGTQPTTPESKELSQARLDRIIKFDIENDSLLGNNNSMISTDMQPVSKESNGLTLSDMRGLNFYDGTWDLLLNQLDYDSDELSNMLFNAAFTTRRWQAYQHRP